MGIPIDPETLDPLLFADDQFLITGDRDDFSRYVQNTVKEYLSEP